MPRTAMGRAGCALNLLVVLLTLILTEWGSFTCGDVTCVRDRERGIRLYWSPPTLVITKDHRPLVKRICDRVEGEPATWDCRAERGTAPQPPASGR